MQTLLGRLLVSSLLLSGDFQQNGRVWCCISSCYSVLQAVRKKLRCCLSSFCAAEGLHASANISLLYNYCQLYAQHQHYM
jgi:hypothetical protein